MTARPAAGPDADCRRHCRKVTYLHLPIAAACFYRFPGGHTWRIIFKRDLAMPDDAVVQREMVVQAVLAFLASDGD